MKEDDQVFRFHSGSFYGRSLGAWVDQQNILDGVESTKTPNKIRDHLEVEKYVSLS